MIKQTDGTRARGSYLAVDGLRARGRSQRLGDSAPGVKGHGLGGFALRPEALGKHALLVVEVLHPNTHTKENSFLLISTAMHI